MSISYVQNGDSGLVARTLINQAIDGVNSGSFPYTGNARITGSLSITGSTSSTLGFTGSLQGTATSASYVLNAVSASFVTTASYVLQAVSASFATTASFALNGGSTDTGSLLMTASVSSNIITFTKGNGTTFPITVNTGSVGSSFPYTGSAIISGSLIITGSTISTLGFTGSLEGTANKVLITDFTSSASDNKMVFIKDIATGTTHIDSAGLSYKPSTKTYSGEANYDITSGSFVLTGSLKLNGGGITGAGTGVMFIDSNNIVSNIPEFTAIGNVITGGSRGTMNLSNLGVSSAANGLRIPTTIPSAPNTGSMYVDFVALKLYLYNGTVWVSSSLG